MEPAPHIVRRGRGMPLIGLHGNGVDHRLLLPLDGCFVVAEWERLYLDLPGFGRTPPLPDPGGLPELADWLVDQVAQLVGERRFAVLASSLGGLLARHLLAEFGTQVAGLALVAPVVFPDPAERALPDRTVIERDEALLAHLDSGEREQFTTIAARQTADSWHAFRDHALPGIRTAHPEAMARLSQRYFLDPAPGSAALFDRPTLIITGKQDHIVGHADQLVLLDHFTAATYVALDGAGHNVHLEQPAIAGQLVRDWASRVEAA